MYSLDGSCNKRRGKLLSQHEVNNIKRNKGDTFTISTKNNKHFISKYIVNAAGLYADFINELVNEKSFTIIPTKGEYFLLDKQSPERVEGIIFQCPNENGKGVLVSNTIHRNIIIGPNASVIKDKDDTSNTIEGLEFVRKSALKTVPSLNFSYNLRNFAGIRANTDKDDFIVGFASDKFYNIAGIKSPGLSSAPALALECIADLKNDGLELKEKINWNYKRKFIRFKRLSDSEKHELIQQRPSYGRVYCRCMGITEAEIQDAYKVSPAPLALDAIKRRTGAGLGRCQGGFCVPKMIELLVKETKCKPEDIIQNQNGSQIILEDRQSGN